MTLLVLDLHAPDSAKIATERDFLLEMTLLWPRLLVYLMSFLTLGIFWIGNQTQLDQIERSDRHYTWLNLAVLVTVTLIPFSTSQLATFIDFRSALLIYWVNILAFGITVLAAWFYAVKARLVKTNADPAFHQAFTVRVCSAQIFYAGAVFLSFVFDTHISIALIVLVQLNYAVGLKVVFRRK